MSKLTVTCALLLALGDWTHLRACSTRHRMDFSAATTSDHYQVRGWNSEVVATVTEPQKVQAAAAFIIQHSDDFSEVLSGPQAPILQMEFLHGSQSLTSFGIGDTYLTDGSVSRPTSAAEIDGFMRQLDLKWPKR